MRKLVLLIATVLMVGIGYSQEMSDEYALDAPEEGIVLSDNHLLYRNLGARQSIFTELSRFGFLHTAYRHRGAAQTTEKHFVGSLSMSSEMNRYPDYAFISALRDVSYGAPSIKSYSNRVVNTYSISPYWSDDGYVFKAVYAQRKYLVGLKAQASGRVAAAGTYAVSVQYRTGRDTFINGVYTDAVSFAACYANDFKKNGSLSLAILGTISEQGLRSYSTREAFSLTGDNLYNPSWGHLNGRVANSRVRSDRTPIVVANYKLSLNKKTTLYAAAGYRFGERGVSGLSWYDASNPAPDYYSKMPSYYDDPAIGEIVADKWRANDERYTQVDWASVYDVNKHSGGESKYVLEDRVERLNNFQVALNANTVINKKLDMVYGVRYRNDNSRFFKRLKETLGGDYIIDIDQYARNESTHHEKYQNDLRNPGRVVREGDKFGYDYVINRSEITAHGSLRYFDSYWSVDAYAELGQVGIRRNGNYEKEIFPGALSYGRSDRHSLTTYSINVLASYRLRKGIDRLTVGVSTDALPPSYEDMFYEPRYYNGAPKDIKTTLSYGGEIEYDFRRLFNIMDIELAGYLRQSSREREMFRYYDDIYSTYCYLDMNGISKRSAGVEIGVKVEPFNNFEVKGVFAYNSYKYTSNPTVEIFAENGMTPLLNAANSYLAGYVSSASPQTMFALSLSYSTRNLWYFNISYSYAGRRYIDINPNYRTNLVLDFATSPEMQMEFASQEKLPSAAMLDFFVSKRFIFGKGTLFLTLSINNVLNDKDIVYNGYEQMRIRKKNNAYGTTYSPFASKYMYYYPRTIYITATYSF